MRIRFARRGQVLFQKQTVFLPQAVLVNTKILRYYIFAAYAAFDRSQRKKFTAGIGGGEQMSGTGIVWKKRRVYHSFGGKKRT